MANTAEVLQVTMVPTAIENFKGKKLLGFSCSPFMPTGGLILASGTSLAVSSGMLALRDVAQLGSWNEAHAKLPKCLGSGAQVHSLWQWHWCLRCENVKISRGKGVWISAAYRSDSS